MGADEQRREAVSSEGEAGEQLEKKGKKESQKKEDGQVKVTVEVDQALY